MRRLSLCGLQGCPSVSHLSFLFLTRNPFEEFFESAEKGINGPTSGSYQHYNVRDIIQKKKSTPTLASALAGKAMHHNHSRVSSDGWNIFFTLRLFVVVIRKSMRGDTTVWLLLPTALQWEQGLCFAILLYASSWMWLSSASIYKEKRSFRNWITTKFCFLYFHTGKKICMRNGNCSVLRQAANLAPSLCKTVEFFLILWLLNNNHQCILLGYYVMKIKQCMKW